MARFNGIESIPQTAQSVNVGQFGPSYDSLQDWRSVFTAAAEVKKIAADLEGTDEEIKDLTDQAAAIVVDANNAVSLANQINEDTIEATESRWQDIKQVEAAIENDRVDVENNTNISLNAAQLSQDEATKSTASASDAAESLARVEGIDATIKNVKASGYSLSEGTEATATFDTATSTIRIGIPTRIADVPGKVQIWHNGSFVADGQVRLTAADVSALPSSGDVPIKDKLSFQVDGGKEFEIKSKLVSGDSQLTLLSEGVARKGLVIDSTGDAAFGGRLFVNNLTSANRKEVFHEGKPPTASQVGAYAKDETLNTTAIQANYRRKDDSYSRGEIDNKVAAKVELNKSDGTIYARQNAVWVDVGTDIAKVNTKADKTDLDDVKADIANLKQYPKIVTETNIGGWIYRTKVEHANGYVEVFGHTDAISGNQTKDLYFGHTYTNFKSISAVVTQAHLNPSSTERNSSIIVQNHTMAKLLSGGGNYAPYYVHIKGY